MPGENIEGELDAAVTRPSSDKGPRPDEVLNRVIKLVYGIMEEEVGRLFRASLHSWLKR
jgi:hypothetical protein